MGRGRVEAEQSVAERAEGLAVEWEGAERLVSARGVF